jgi:hypothetical protein
MISLCRQVSSLANKSAMPRRRTATRLRPIHLFIRQWSLHRGRRLPRYYRPTRLPNRAAYDVCSIELISTTDVPKSKTAAMYLALASYAINGFETISDLDAPRKVALQIAGLFERQGHQHGHANNSFEVDIDIKIMFGMDNFTNKAIESMGRNNKLMIEQIGRAKTYIDKERHEKSREALAKDLQISGPVTI